MSDATSRNPVLLLHGLDDTATLFDPMTHYLEQQGWEVHSLDLEPNCGRAGLEVLGQQVAAYVEQEFPDNRAFDLVGFSMGGIVGRYYVQRLGGIQRVQRFITIASPHHGTLTSHFRDTLGCEQMRPGSSFLADLNRDVKMLSQINFTSIWTPLDLIIVPASSSHLPVGKEILIWVGGHAWMVTSSRCLRAIAQTLSEPLRHSTPAAYEPGVSPI